MSIQFYSKLYSKYNGSNCFESKADGSIAIPLFHETSMRYAILKCQSLNQLWTDCSRPLVNAITAFFQTQTVKTVFYDETTWCVLLGNQKLVYPRTDGQTSLTITSYFVKESNLNAFHTYMTTNLNAVCSHNYIYQYNGAIVYMDPFELLYPGGYYFDQSQNPNNLYRICYLTAGQGGGNNSSSDNNSNNSGNNDNNNSGNNSKNNGSNTSPMEKIILEKYLVFHMPFKSKSVETEISRFVQLHSPIPIRVPEEQYRCTDIIKKFKCGQKPQFIIQDILDSFGNPYNLGLIIEAPISVSYEFDNILQDQRKFYAIAVNCIVPQKYIHVPKPYDRYYKYDSLPKNLLQWSTVLYDRNENIPILMDTVIWDYNILGYVYRDTFFCLSHVKLCSNLAYKYRNVAKLFGKLSFDLADCPDFTVLNSFPINGNYRLYCLKHKCIRHELWCLEQTANLAQENYLRKQTFPSLVYSWITLLLNVSFTTKKFNSLNFVRLLYVLTRHNICFSMQCSNSDDEAEMRFENDKDIVFYVKKGICEFINQLRFEKDIQMEHTDTCNIL